MYSMLQKKRKFISINIRLFFFINLIIIFSITTVSLLSIYREKYNFRKELINKAQSLLRSLESTISDYLYFSDIDAINDITKKLIINEPGILSLHVYDTNGIIISNVFQNNFLMSAEPDPIGFNLIQKKDNSYLNWQKDCLITGKIIEIEEQVIGAISICFSMSPLKKEINAIITQGIFISLLTLVISSLFSVFISRTITKPIHDLVVLTRSISNGNFPTEYQYKRQDEIGLLFHAFYSMSQKISRLVANLSKAKEEAETATKAKSQFMAMVSHDLKTPIINVITACQLMLKTSLSKKQLQYLKIIKNSSHELTAFITDILNYEKLQSNKIKINKHLFNIYKLFYELFLLYKNRADKKNLQFKLITKLKHKNVIGDSKKLKQIINNLMDNALKYTETGKIHLKIEQIKTKISKIWYKITILDTGIGIQENKLKKIYSDYYQVNKIYTKEKNSVGLGLSIVKRIVKLLKGKILIKSELGKGSQFIVILPFKINKNYKIVNNKKKLPITNHQQEKESKSGSITDARILLAEDDLIIQLYIASFIKDHGGKVDCVANGKELITKWKDFEYNLILMDVSMPKLNGIQATHIIREHEKKSKKTHIPIIGMTAYSSEDDIKRFLEAGMDDCLTKPINEGKLLTIINKTMNKY